MSDRFHFNRPRPPFRPGLLGPFGPRWRPRHPFRGGAPTARRGNPLALPMVLATMVALAIAVIATLGLALLFSRGRLRRWRGAFGGTMPGAARPDPLDAGGDSPRDARRRSRSYAEVIEVLPAVLGGALLLFTT